MLELEGEKATGAMLDAANKESAASPTTTTQKTLLCSTGDLVNGE